MDHLAHTGAYPLFIFAPSSNAPGTARTIGATGTIGITRANGATETTGRLKKLKARRKGPGMLCRLIQLLAVVSTSFLLCALGFCCCCMPLTTQILAELTSNFEDSPYEPETLITLAQLTRAYTVDGSGYQELCQAEVEAALGYYEENEQTIPEFLLNAINVVDGVTAAQTLAFFDERLALDQDAIRHLDEVHRVIVPVLLAFALSVIASIGLLVILGIRHGKRQLGIPLIIAAILVIALFIALLSWALTDFDSLFAALHGLFFAKGTWTFNPQSLLITMYPEAFWMGMGIVWVSVSLLTSLIVLITGILTVRNH